MDNSSLKSYTSEYARVRVFWDVNEGTLLVRVYDRKLYRKAVQLLATSTPIGDYTTVECGAWIAVMPGEGAVIEEVVESLMNLDSSTSTRHIVSPNKPSKWMMTAFTLLALIVLVFFARMVFIFYSMM